MSDEHESAPLLRHVEGEVDIEAVAGLTRDDHEHVRGKRLIERLLRGQRQGYEAEREEKCAQCLHCEPQSR